MKSKEVLTIGLTFRDTAEIEEVLKLMDNVCKKGGFRQRTAYLAGLRALNEMLEKAKGLVIKKRNED